jgi:hypothetical protein
MSRVYELAVEVSESEAKALEQYDDERLEELASAEAKRDELRRRRPESTSENPEELSGDELEEAMREWLKGDRATDPRLD